LGRVRLANQLRHVRAKAAEADFEAVFHG
jgi:hypothetical protein